MDEINMIARRAQVTAEQYDTLLRPIRPGRVSTRRQGGKDLSYVEAWDVKAHLTRIFGFGNWDSEMLDYHHVLDRPYVKDGKDMVEVVYTTRMQLTIHVDGIPLCRHSEAAAGSTSGPASLIGEHHDNSIKAAASDALKRCAINLGSQFGLSLYNNGSRQEVVRQTIVKPADWAPPAADPERAANVTDSLGGSGGGDG